MRMLLLILLITIGHTCHAQADTMVIKMNQEECACEFYKNGGKGGSETYAYDSVITSFVIIDTDTVQMSKISPGCFIRPERLMGLNDSVSVTLIFNTGKNVYYIGTIRELVFSTMRMCLPVKKKPKENARFFWTIHPLTVAGKLHYVGKNKYGKKVFSNSK